MIASAAALSAALLFTGCSPTLAPTSASGNGGDNGKTIGIAVADQKSLFYVAAVDGMEQAADEAGYKLVTLSANNNSSQQVNQVQDLITQQVDVIIFIAQDATSAAAGVKLANDAGVPIIAVDQKPESGNGKLATYIATDSVAAAEKLCTWMFDQFGGAGDIAILQGPLAPPRNCSAAKAARTRWRSIPTSMSSLRNQQVGTRPKPSPPPKIS